MEKTKIDVLDLLFMTKKEFQDLDGEFIDQLPPKQINRIPNCLWDMMTEEQLKRISTFNLSTLDYNELVKLYIKYIDSTEPYTIEYKIKDKTTTIESNGLEPKLHEVISQQKRYANFKARSRFNKKDCTNNIMLCTGYDLYNYLPKTAKDYISWDKNKQHYYTAKKHRNPMGTKTTEFYFEFDDICKMLKLARRDGEYILNDEIPPLLPFTTLMSRYKVKYSLSSQFLKRWKLPYYTFFYGRELTENSDGRNLYDVVECEPMLKKILQIEYAPVRVKKYHNTNIIPKFCLQKIYPFLEDEIDNLINTQQIDLYRGEENLLDYNSVIDYIENKKINKNNKKPKDLPFLIDFYDYFDGLDLPNELLSELKDKLDTYAINDKIYLHFPFEIKHKTDGKYDNFRLKIISIIQEYVVYKSKLNQTQNNFYTTNKIPDIYIECITSKLINDNKDLKKLYLSNVQEFYPVYRLDGLGYGDIGYMDYSKAKKYFDI